MVRVTNSVARHKKRKKLFKEAKGFWGDRKNHIRLTKDAVMKALAYKFAHRKKKKSDFRQLWIIRIGSAAKMNGMSYSKLIHGLKLANVEIDRKILADLALNDPQGFAEVVGVAKGALS